ncbi:MAG: DegV family EDD domain-containing protein [Lachnospiraceae bacterium]|nr:DegV family EDD domain-containing protein [Lachnospiraceae bacterium]
MADFVIIPDAACSMTADLRERFGIPDYIRTRITWPDGSNHDTTLDWEEISADDYYLSMREHKALYKTGVGSIDAAAEVFERYLKIGLDVLSITLSTGISGTFSVFTKAAEQLREKYPDRKIIIVDSLRYGFAITQMIIKATEMKEAGSTIEEVAAWLEANRNCYHQMGVMDDLFFLARTGRVTNFKAFFGTLVGVNAMGDYSRAGISEVLAKIKGKKKALDATIEYLKRTVVDPENQIMFIGHTMKQDAADILYDMVNEAVHPKELIIGRVDMSCGANIGPGMAVVFYYGKEASEGLVEEKKIMEEIANAK